MVTLISKSSYEVDERHKCWTFFSKLVKPEGKTMWRVACNLCEDDGVPANKNVRDGRVRDLMIHLKNHHPERYMHAFPQLVKHDESSTNNDESSITQGPSTEVAPTDSSLALVRTPSDNTAISSLGVGSPISMATSKQSANRSTSKGPKIRNWMETPLSDRDKQLFQTRLIEFVADTAIPFTVAEKGSFKRLVESIRPMAVQAIPKRKRLSGSILKEAASASVNKILPKMRDHIKRYGCQPGFVCDSWVDVSKSHILGVVVSLKHMHFAFDNALGDGNLITDDEHHGIATAKQIESAIEKTNQHFRFSCSNACTDDAGQCSRAKRILSLRFPNLYFGRCYAHQVHLIVKDVFKVVFVETVDRVKRLITKYNASTSKWLVRLDKIQEELYGTSLALIRVVEVRWNSIQAAFASVLRIKSALKVVHAKHGSSSDFPKDLVVDDEFFDDVSDAEAAIRPMTKASLLMQRQDNTLAEVMYMFASIYHSFASHESLDNQLVPLIERRWKVQEQPLLLVAFMLHPLYIATFRQIKNNTNVTSLMYMTNFCQLYYKKYIGDDTSGLIKELVDWYHGDVTESVSYVEQVVERQMSYTEFWHIMRTSLPKLSTLAMKILYFVVQTATCERLFSAFGNFITKQRNRMHSKTTHYLTQVKRSVADLDANEVMCDGGKEKKLQILDPTERERRNDNDATIDLPQVCATTRRVYL